MASPSCLMLQVERSAASRTFSTPASTSAAALAAASRAHPSMRDRLHFLTWLVAGAATVSASGVVMVRPPGTASASFDYYASAVGKQRRASSNATDTRGCPSAGAWPYAT